MAIFKQRSSEQIKKAQQIADDAIGIFQATVDKLQAVNETLFGVIESEQEKISEAHRNIDLASSKISTNQKIIQNLKSFTIE